MTTTIDTFMFGDPALLAPHFAGETWSTWRVALKAAFSLPLRDAELDTFHEIAGDRAPPTRQVRELWAPVGRNGGKDSIASGIGTYVAASTNFRENLRPGEKASILCLACDRIQAAIVFGYIKGYFEEVPLLAAMVTRMGPDFVELNNGAEIIVATNSYRSIRGRTIVCAIYDECAFWRDDNSANPDIETDNAIDPGMLRWSGSLKIGISSVYRRQGLLYTKWRDYFGKADDDVLVISGPSRTFNPTLPQSLIDKKMAEDPASAGAEYYCRWRDDLASYVTREAVEACVATGRVELPPIPGAAYKAFFDGAGGSGQDSVTVAIAHRGPSGIGILDAVREVRPPFAPSAVIEEFCALLKLYGIGTVCGDRWGGGFPPEQFAKYGVSYEVSEKAKADIYRDFLPLLNSAMVQLLDHQRLISQLLSLERRTAWGGRDTIDHPKGSAWHDDVINSVSGVLVEVAGKPENDTMAIWAALGAPAGESGRAYNAWLARERGEPPVAREPVDPAVAEADLPTGPIIAPVAAPEPPAPMPRPAPTNLVIGPQNRAQQFNMGACAGIGHDSLTLAQLRRK